MINLLNPHDKKRLRAARRNTVWSRYTFLILALLLAINIVLGFTIFFIQTQARTYQDRVASNEQLSNQRYSTTKKKFQSFRDDLSTAKTILEGETNYSKIIIAVAQSLPAGCVSGSLSFSAATFNVPQTITFHCKSSDDILRLKSTLEQHSELYDKVNIVSAAIAPSSPTPYPVEVSMSLVIKKPTTAGGGL